MGKAVRQLDLDLRRHGGRRPGAGRKPNPGRGKVPHRVRESFTVHSPVLVSQRLIEGLPTLRNRTRFGILLQAFAKGCDRLGGRLIQFSVQSNHIHMIVEAESEVALARFMAGLKIRVARAINKHLGRTGRVFADRYHSKALKSPRQARNALRYLMNNDLHHHVRRGATFDLYSSAPYFDGFAEGKVSWPCPLAVPPCVPARAWLLTTGWRRHHGPFSLGDVPSA